MGMDQFSERRLAENELLFRHAKLGHENKTIEEVVTQHDGYNIIQKFIDPAEAIVGI